MPRFKITLRCESGHEQDLEFESAGDKGTAEMMARNFASLLDGTAYPIHPRETAGGAFGVVGRCAWDEGDGPCGAWLMPSIVEPED